jgi:hypothetical protein
MRLYKFFSGFLSILFFFHSSFAQKKNNPDFSGTWAYEVRNTPSGDYSGNIILIKVNQQYTGNIINTAGMKDTIHVLESKGNKLVFTSDIEDAHETFSCTFFGDSVRADIKVEGDDFDYQLRGKKESAKKTQDAK